MVSWTKKLWCNIFNNFKTQIIIFIVKTYVIMTDASLDEFFAKKDKSKKSKTKKFTTSDQIAKKIEETGKKSSTKQKKEKEKVQQTLSVIQNEEQEDDEWHDFQQPTEKDYSGLRIQSLQISSSNEEEQDKDEEEELNEDGQPKRSKDCSTGPWNKASGQAPPPPPPDPQPVPVVVEEKKEESKSVGVYRPPAMRMSSQSSATSNQRKSHRSAPEISSEVHFPSLGAATAERTGRDLEKGSDWSFETVKHGSRTSEPVTNRGPRLDLGNKFDALSQREDN